MKRFPPNPHRSWPHRGRRSSPGRIAVAIALLPLMAMSWHSAEAGSDEFPAIPYKPAPWHCCALEYEALLTEPHASCLGDGTIACNSDSLHIDDADSTGLKRDTWYFLGYQAATIGILYAMPESVSGWSDQQKSGYSLSIWWDNVSHPQMDTDDFYINYILHPYWGAAYFVRAKERGYGNVGSFWYSAMLSSAYEFGAEALFEEPSIQDLIVTPVLGSVVGMYFMHVRDNIQRRDIDNGYRSTKDKWLWVLTDPLGSLNRRFDRWFGWDTNLRVRAYNPVNSYDIWTSLAPDSRKADRVYALEFTLRW